MHLAPPPTRSTTLHHTATVLAALLDEVSADHLDAQAWAEVNRRGRIATAVLADAGVLPRGLVIDATDPPPVVGRLLAIAARLSSRATAAD